MLRVLTAFGLGLINCSRANLNWYLPIDSANPQPRFTEEVTFDEEALGFDRKYEIKKQPEGISHRKSGRIKKNIHKLNTDDCTEEARRYLSGEALISAILLCREVGPPNVDSIIDLSISLNVKKVLGLGSDGILRLAVSLTYTWADPRMTYNGYEYVRGWLSSKDSVHLPFGHKMWTPDVFPSNARMANAVENENMKVFQPRIYDKDHLYAKKWNVVWERLMTLNLICASHFETFPFDSQVCQISFAGWVTRKDQTFGPSRNIIRFYPQNFGPLIQFREPEKNMVSAWEIQTVGDVRAEMNKIDYSVGYTVRLKRSSQFYILNFVWPAIVLLLFCYITLWLPSYWYDRVLMTVTLLLSMFQVMGLMAIERPNVSSDTWIDAFLSYCIILTLFPSFEIILVNSITESQTRKARLKYQRNIWMRYFVLKNQCVISDVKTYKHYDHWLINDEDPLQTRVLPQNQNITYRHDKRKRVAAPKYDSIFRIIWKSLYEASHLRYFNPHPQFKGLDESSEDPDKYTPWSLDAEGKAANFWHWKFEWLKSEERGFVWNSLFDPDMWDPPRVALMERSRIEYEAMNMTHMIDSVAQVCYPGIILALLAQSFSSLFYEDIEVVFTGNDAILVYSLTVTTMICSLWLYAIIQHYVYSYGFYHRPLEFGPPEDIGVACSQIENLHRRNNYLTMAGTLTRNLEAMGRLH